MIYASVLLPLFRTKYIAWLQLDSLCRQRDVDFEWELLIAEELEDESFGEHQVKQYQTRLEQVGCTRLHYTSLKTWITLGAKWKTLIDQTSPSSSLFFRSAADQYSPPHMLSTLYALHKTHPEADWFIPATSLDYDIKTGKSVMRKLDLMKVISKPDISGGAASASLLRAAAAIFKVDQMISLVDGKIWAYCKLIKPQGMNIIRDFSDNWKFGLNVNGLGNITDRAFIFTSHPPLPFIPYPYDLRDSIPKDILFRLNNSRKFLSLHTRKVPPY